MEKLDEALLESVVHWAAARVGEAAVLAARKAFELRTGPIEQGDPDFESRMGHFFEHWLCDGEGGPSLIEHYASEGTRAAQALRQLAGWQRSHRALLEFEDFRDGLGVVRDLLLGGRYRFLPGPHDRELAPGDRFDGRIVAGASQLWLSPGRVYHPRAAFAALDRLLQEPAARALPPRALLDGLLRMRSRLTALREHSPRARLLGGWTDRAPPSLRPGRGLASARARAAEREAPAFARTRTCRIATKSARPRACARDVRSKGP